MISVPFLVNYYLKGFPFPNRFRRWVIWGGIAWLIFAFVAEEYVNQFLGLVAMDANVHWSQAQAAAEELARNNWPFASAWPLGNEAYIAYLAHVYLFTGCTPIFPIAINALFAFWGGLVLARSLGDMLAFSPNKVVWFFLIIFFPSTVFWATSNLKEAFMYWGGCQIFSIVLPGRRNSSLFLSPGAVAGIIVAGILRPHICVVWLGACASVSFFQRGKRVYAVLLLMLLPLAESGLKKTAGVELSAPTSAVEKLSRQQSLQLGSEAGGSKIEYGEEGAIFFVSGFASIFLRPFPWEIRSLRVFISSVETWAVTILLIMGWLRMTPWERRLALKTPAIQAAILVCIVFSIFFTYLPNEGLMVRQRVQMIPALLVLSLFPILLRSFLVNKTMYENQRGAARFGAIRSTG